MQSAAAEVAEDPCIILVVYVVIVRFFVSHGILLGDRVDAENLQEQWLAKVRAQLVEPRPRREVFTDVLFLPRVGRLPEETAQRLFPRQGRERRRVLPQCCETAVARVRRGHG